MGILLADSLLSNKVLVGFIIFVFIYGMCIGPKGKSGSSKRDNTKDLKFKAANIMQGRDTKRK